MSIGWPSKRMWGNRLVMLVLAVTNTAAIGATEKKEGVKAQPSLAFLEFIADLEQDEGAWLSPIEMDLKLTNEGESQLEQPQTKKNNQKKVPLATPNNSQKQGESQ